VARVTTMRGVERPEEESGDEARVTTMRGVERPEEESGDEALVTTMRAVSRAGTGVLPSRGAARGRGGQWDQSDPWQA
jgi:hypothetical protein